MERLLATTSIHATDVDSGMSFLEHAAHTGDIQLAKLCFRRGMKLNMICQNGDTPFNITVARRDHHMMEFLHNYGVKVNAQDRNGVTALHTATEKNDVDAVCRLIEWAADINIVDKQGRTPLHFAGKYGHNDAAMLLLELAADMNAMDEKNSTPTGYAEAHDHFGLMDRLVMLGGRVMRPGLADAKKQPGEVDQPKFMLQKGPHLLRLQKIPVPLI
jgi:ankyrin repeat protein